MKAEEKNHNNEELETRVKLLEEENAGLKKRKEELLSLFSGLAHDCNQSLTAIQGYIELLYDNLKPGLDQGNENFFYSLMSASEKAIEIIRMMGKIKLQEAVKIEKSVFPLEEVAKKSLMVAQALVPGKKIDWSLNLPENLPLVESDESLIFRVITNLLSNAGKFSENSGAVSVSAFQDNLVFLTVVVKDDGIGIEKEYLEVIFEKDYRVEGNGRKGDGIGLFNCKNIIERHGGQIWAESLGYGQGASFYFTLPVAKPFLSG